MLLHSQILDLFSLIRTHSLKVFLLHVVDFIHVNVLVFDVVSFKSDGLLKLPPKVLEPCFGRLSHWNAIFFIQINEVFMCIKV